MRRTLVVVTWLAIAPLPAARAGAAVPVANQARAVVQRGKTFLLRVKREVERSLGKARVDRVRVKLRAIGMDADAPVIVLAPQTNRRITASLFLEERLLRGATPSSLAGRRHARVEAEYQGARDADQEIAASILPPLATAMTRPDGFVFMHVGATKYPEPRVDTIAHELRHVKEIPRNLKRLEEASAAWNRAGEDPAARQAAQAMGDAAIVDAELSAHWAGGYALGRTGHARGSPRASTTTSAGGSPRR